MKIAYFVNEYPKVSHSFIRREILALERQGFDILRISLRGWNSPLVDAEDADERTRTRYVLRGGALSLLAPTVRRMLGSPLRFWQALRLAVRSARDSARPLPYHLVYLAEACRILSWLKSAGSTHVHAHFGTNPAEVVMLVRALGGPPYSFTVHGPDEYLRPMTLDEKVRNSAFTVAISSFGRSQLYLRCAPADWPKVKVVHCGVEQSFHNVAATTLTSAPRLVCVGRLCEAKGQLLLLAAAAQLVARGVALELVLAGDGPLRPLVEAEIRRLGLEQTVRITGWLSSAQVREQILAARALVLPSFAEGLPVVLMEAMALRRPVLSTYVAGIPELLQHGVNGWLFPAGSIEELVRAMEECLVSPPEHLQALGNAGRIRVLERHDVDTEALKLAQHIRASANPSGTLPS